MFTVRTFRHGPFWNFSYLLAVPGGEAAVIDPGGVVHGLIAAAEAAESRITAVVLTHGHHDHLSGLAELVSATGAGVFAHQAEVGAVLRGSGMEATTVGHQSKLSLGPHEATLLHTPGHTEGSLCVLSGEHLFTGDTLMTSGPGRHALRPGAAERLARSLAEVVAPLPGETTIYPGHDEGPAPTATLAEALGRDSRSGWAQR